MNKQINFLTFFLVAITALFIFLSSCGKKEEVPSDSPVQPSLYAAAVGTSAVVSITQTTASSGGSVGDDGGGAVTARGVCWSSTTNPTIANSKTSDGTGIGNFSSSLTGLSAGVKYYVRAYATNKAGTSYGNEITFTTSSNISLATVTTAAVTIFTSTTATIGGNVTGDGNSAVTERGTCVSTSPNPTTASDKFSKGTGLGSFTSDITGFVAGTTYYIRAYAINSKGTVYGNEVIFITPAATPTTGSVTDFEGNSYKTISIGTQIWMTENLKSTKYKDGTAITLVTDNATWESYPSAAYCWYDNNASNKSVYGALYNWAVVSSGKLCPTGWHVPSDAEWTTLTTFLGGMNVAAGKMKETGTSHWITPNTTATNSSGFTALPGGSRGGFGQFQHAGDTGIWWSSKEESATWAFRRYMYNNEAGIYGGPSSKQFGFSVRCVKD